MKSPWRTRQLALCAGWMLVIFAQRCKAQGNLVPNPSFELQDTCPYTPGFQGNAKPLYWENWNQSPDYFDDCAGTGGLDTLLDVPQNGFGFQSALDGEAYLGLYAYGYVSWLPDGNYREYVGCELLQTLEVGETYEVSFHTNMAMDGNYWPMAWACNNMGVLFTMQPNIWTDVDEPLFAVRNYAHVNNIAVISDTAGWTLVGGSFVADSAYQYMVIGNFFSNALTDTLHLGNPSLGAYYFVDDVCVVKAGQFCNSSEGVVDFDSAALLVWPNPAAEVLVVSGIRNGENWQVVDLTGRVVQFGAASGVRLEIPVMGWSSGEYLLRVGTGTRRHVRFVVMP